MVIQNQQSIGNIWRRWSFYIYLNNLLIITYTCFRLVNGKELTNKDGVQIEKDLANNKYSLTIPKANPSIHAGTITIKATNTIGSVSHDLILNILGKNDLIIFYDKINIEFNLSIF